MKISIITVAYNSEKSIIPSIESVIAQCGYCAEVEYWIIDGKSKDKTVEVAESYRLQLEEKGIDYHIISESDGGIYDAMNKGILRASGDVIGILNTDDWYEPHTFRVVCDTFQKRKCDLMFGNIRIHRQDGTSFIKKARQRKFQTSRDWNHPTTFVKAELYKKYPFLNKGIHDDYGFYLRMRKLQVKIVTVDQVLANFKMGGASNRKSLQASIKRIRDRYQYCYLVNGYSKWYLVECLMIEVVKYVLG